MLCLRDSLRVYSTRPLPRAHPLARSDVEAGIESTLVVAGDARAGKSSLILRFLEKGRAAGLELAIAGP